MIWNSRVDAFSPSDTLTLLASNKRNAVSGARLPTAAHPPGAGGLDRQPQADLPAVPQRWPGGAQAPQARSRGRQAPPAAGAVEARSEEHTSELQSLMRISYAVFCLKKKKTQ